jgi:hypothetical protein
MTGKANLDAIDRFMNCMAGAMVCASRQPLWRLRLEHISAVAEKLGIISSDLEPPDGRVYAEIMRRVSILSSTTANGHNPRRDALRTAQESFGPAGSLAPNFMIRDIAVEEKRPAPAQLQPSK